MLFIHDNYIIGAISNCRQIILKK